MIDRFNFYDVYGYLIPGAILIALIWLPHAIVAGQVPAGDVSAALAALVGAYVAGLILQVLLNRTIPTNANKDDRFPSDRMLDEDDQTFPPEMKKAIAAQIRRRFALDVTEPSARGVAFYLCRDALIAAKTTSYVEQFQGMYALMRGICGATAVGFAYDIGWLCSPLLNSGYRDLVAASVLLFLGVVLASRIKNRTIFGVSFLLGCVVAGVLAAGGTERHVGLLLAAAGLSLLVSIWAFGAYRTFAWEWARTVYRNFYLLSRQPPSKSA